MNATLNATPEVKQDAPKKVLTQDVLYRSDVSNWIRFAAVDGDGRCFGYRDRPTVNEKNNRWDNADAICEDYMQIGGGYDATDWQHSLVERISLPAVTGIDWENAPEGATHYMDWSEQTNECYYRNDFKEIWVVGVKGGDKWRPCVDSPSDYASAIARPASTASASTASLITDEQAEQLGQDAPHWTVETINDLQDQIAALEAKSRTQAENVAFYAQSLLACNDQCEKLKWETRVLTADRNRFVNLERKARYRIERHVIQYTQYERYIATLDTKCLKLTTRLAAAQDKADQLAEQNAVLRNRIKADAYVHDSDNELITDAKRGLKYTGIMLLIIVALAGLYRCEGEPVRHAGHVASGVAK